MTHDMKEVNQEKSLFSTIDNYRLACEKGQASWSKFAYLVTNIIVLNKAKFLAQGKFD